MTACGTRRAGVVAFLPAAVTLPAALLVPAASSANSSDLLGRGCHSPEFPTTPTSS